MVFLEFEKPIADLYDQLNKLKAMDSEGTVDLDATVAALEKGSRLSVKIYIKTSLPGNEFNYQDILNALIHSTTLKGSLLTSLSFMVTEMYTMIKPL